MSNEDKTKNPNDPAVEVDDELDLDDSDLDELDLDDEDQEDAEDLDEDPSEAGVEEDPSKKKVNIATLNIQRKKFRERALAAEARVAELEKKQTKPNATSKKPDVSVDKAERMDFRFDHPELSSKEVDEIEAIARAKGLSLEQAMKSPVIKIYLKASARKREHSIASPETRHRAAPRIKGKDPITMSTEEFEAYKRQVKSGAFKQ